MKKICIVTATRAEYGLLKPLIVKFKQEEGVNLRVVATGAHLSPEFGLTFQEIEKDGIKIDRKIEMLLSADTPAAISKSMGLAMIGFADYFARETPDVLIVLGDRYETLAVCSVAMNFQIPIAHLYGGETTEGAIDEAIRHAITKMSYLHFTSTETYRKRVIQLGEDPQRVFNVGAMGVENIKTIPLLSLDDLSRELVLDLKKPYAVVTYHPETLGDSSPSKEAEELLRVCKDRKDLEFIITKANADAEGRSINQMIEQYEANSKNMHAFTSLGLTKYLSALKYCKIVIGNSSSGLVEAPSFGVPTINIGNRQKGRLQSESVINCEANYKDIQHAMDKALNEEFVKLAAQTQNPYGKGDTSGKIIAIISEFLNENSLELKKKFYDCEGIVE